MKRAVFVLLAILCLLSVSSITGLIQPVKSDYAWTQTIYIHADGSISPPAAPISSVDNVTYTLTDNIAGNVPLGNFAIDIERNNTVLDGAGHTLQGTNASGSYGIDLAARSNVTVKNMKITAFDWGIYLWYSSNNSVSGNNIASNRAGGIEVWYFSNYNSISGNNITGNTYDGIAVGYSSSHNSVSGNNITSNNGDGIYLTSSNNNTVSGNNMTNNEVGIYIYPDSFNNTIYHNNFINNSDQAYSSNATNVWDNGSSGNYWSDYLTKYPSATQVDNSGVWNTPYVIDANNTDRYPLMAPSGALNPAGAPIYIYADGSINPSNAPIHSADNVTYTLTGNITSNANGIVIQKNNIVLNGAGHTLNGSGFNAGGYGFSSNVNGINHVTIKNTTIANFTRGIYLDSSSNNTVSGNNLTSNKYSIYFDSSSSNTVSGNNVTSGGDGIDLHSSSNNTFSGNNIVSNSGDGIYFDSSSNNTFSGNNIASNSGEESDGIYLYSSSNNILSGNNIASNSGYGIDLDWSSNNTVSGNNMSSNTYDGIYLRSSSSYNVVSGNNITSNSDGIYLYSSSNNTLAGNNVTNNWRGIDLDFASNNNTLSGNTVTTNSHDGIYLSSSSDCTLSGNNVTANNVIGIVLSNSDNNTLSGNNVTANIDCGISLGSSSNNSVSGNNITNNDGIYLNSSSNNSVNGNNIANDGTGIDFNSASNNTIYHNNFMNNSPVYSSNSTNIWDNGYPSGGNYWSNYVGTDSNHDGIGDTPHAIDVNNTDRYPLMGMFYDFNVSWVEPGYSVELISNSSVSAFDVGVWIAHPDDPNTRIIQFNVTGETGTAGFCRVCIPTALLNASYKVLLNGTEIPYTLLSSSNSTHSYLYFNYTHSTEEVTITPEFPSFLILPMFIIATLLAVIVYRKKSARANTGRNIRDFRSQF